MLDCDVLRYKAAILSGGELTSLAAAGDPAEEQQGALGVKAGGAGFEAVLDSLARQSEDAREFHFVAAAMEAGTSLTDQFVPERCGGAGAQCLANPSASFCWERQPGGGTHGRRRGLEESQAQLGRELHLRRNSRGIHRGCMAFILIPPSRGRGEIQAVTDICNVIRYKSRWVARREDWPPGSVWREGCSEDPGDRAASGGAPSIPAPKSAECGHHLVNRKFTTS